MLVPHEGFSVDQVCLNTVFEAEGGSSWIRNYSSLKCDPQLYDRVVQAYNQAVDKHTQPAREARLAERARPMRNAVALYVAGFILVVGGAHLLTITCSRGKLFPIGLLSIASGTAIAGIGCLKMVEESIVQGIGSRFLWLNNLWGDSIDRSKARPFMVSEASLALFSESAKVDFRSLCGRCCSQRKPKAVRKMASFDSWTLHPQITVIDSDSAVVVSDDKPKIIMGTVPNSWRASEAQIIFPVWAYRPNDDFA